MKITREPLTTSRATMLGVVGIIGSGLVAELIMRSSLITTEGLPIPSQVLAGAADLIPNTGFWQDVAFTLGEWGLGLLLATVIGVLLGGLMGAFTSWYTAFEWPVEAFRVLPSVALAPILVLIVGRGMVSLSIAVALACVWPILLNTMYGVRGVDPTAVNTARTLGLSKLQILARIKIPSALPFAFTGVRISASIGLLVAVSVELLVGDGSGIGGFILTQSANATNLDAVYAATIIAGIIGVIVNLVLAQVDGLLFAWKKGLEQ